MLTISLDRDAIAALLLAHKAAAVMPDGDAINTPLLEEDFVEDPEGPYCWSRYSLVDGKPTRRTMILSEQATGHPTRFRLCTTYEQRLTRECIRLADTLVAQALKHPNTYSSICNHAKEEAAKTPPPAQDFLTNYDRNGAQ